MSMKQSNAAKVQRFVNYRCCLSAINRSRVSRYEIPLWHSMEQTNTKCRQEWCSNTHALLRKSTAIVSAGTRYLLWHSMEQTDTKCHQDWCTNTHALSRELTAIVLAGTRYLFVTFLWYKQHCWPERSVK